VLFRKSFLKILVIVELLIPPMTGMRRPLSDAHYLKVGGLAGVTGGA